MSKLRDAGCVIQGAAGCGMVLQCVVAVMQGVTGCGMVLQCVVAVCCCSVLHSVLSWMSVVCVRSTRHTHACRTHSCRTHSCHAHSCHAHTHITHTQRHDSDRDIVYVHISCVLVYLFFYGALLHDSFPEETK